MNHATQTERADLALAALRDRRERAAALSESLTDEIDRRPSTRLRERLDRLAALIDAKRTNTAPMRAGRIAFEAVPDGAEARALRPC